MGGRWMRNGPRSLPPGETAGVGLIAVVLAVTGAYTAAAGGAVYFVASWLARRHTTNKETR